MSDPFHDPTPESPPKTQAGLDVFTTRNLGYYVTDDETKSSSYYYSQLAKESAKPSTSLKTKDTGKRSVESSKPKSTTGKAPAKPKNDSQPAPLRKSPRQNAGKKRKAPDMSSDIEGPSSSPLAKKSKGSNATTATATSVKPSTSTDKRAKSVPPAEASKAKAPTEANHESESSEAEVPAPKTRASKGKKRARTPELDDYADSDLDSDRPPKAKKSKKDNANANDESEQLKDFEATAVATGQGTSENKPDCGTLDTPWKCGNPLCNTGMTWCERGDGSGGKKGGYGRKACSHLFGRNKKQTGYIDDDVWHWFCRKCYQREAYRATRQGTLVEMHATRLRHQIERMQVWRPEMTFTVQLVKKAKERLGDYTIALTNKTQPEAVKAVTFVPGKTTKGKDSKPGNEYLFPIEKIYDFAVNDQTKMTGEGKTYDDLYAICDWIEALNAAGDAPCDPPIEFLPSEKVKGEKVNDPKAPHDNYDQWTEMKKEKGAGKTEKKKADKQKTDKKKADEQKTKVKKVVEKKADVKKAGMKKADESEADESDADERDAEGQAEGADVYDDDDAEVEGTGKAEEGEFDDDTSDDETEDEDDAPAANEKQWSGLRPTKLGLELGFKGNAGIFRGTGIRAEREALERQQKEAERLAREPEQSASDAATSEDEPAIKPEPED